MDKTTKNKILEDKNGNKSSKRLMGFICMGTGLTMAVGVTLIYLIATLKGNEIDITQLRMVFTAIFTAGSALLGIGTFERK